MFLNVFYISALLAFLLYKIYNGEKQKSYNSDIPIEWRNIVEKFLVQFTIALTVFAVFFYALASYYAVTDDKDITKVRKELTGEWKLIGKRGFSNKEIDSNARIIFSQYAKYHNGQFPSEVYKILHITKYSEVKGANGYYVCNIKTNEKDFYEEGLRINFLNADTLMLEHNFYPGYPEKSLIYIYKRLN